MQIRVPTVRLIDEDGSQMGVKPTEEALTLARSKGLDLVEVAAQSSPPVCRILDYAKFRYQQEKRQREAKKKQHTTELKEIRFRPNIGEHDFETKIKHITDFLANKDKVRVSVILHGREVTHMDLGVALMNKVKDRFVEIAIIEQEQHRVANQLSLILAPKRK